MSDSSVMVVMKPEDWLRIPLWTCGGSAFDPDRIDLSRVASLEPLRWQVPEGLRSVDR